MKLRFEIEFVRHVAGCVSFVFVNDRINSGVGFADHRDRRRNSSGYVWRNTRRERVNVIIVYTKARVFDYMSFVSPGRRALLPTAYTKRSSSQRTLRTFSTFASVGINVWCSLRYIVSF